MKKYLTLLFISLPLLAACNGAATDDQPQTPPAQEEAGEENTESLVPAESETQELATLDYNIDAPMTGDKIIQSYKVDGSRDVTFTSLEKGNEVFMDKKAIAKLYENEETVGSFYAPEHPENADIIFISTEGKTTGELPNLISENKIYAYDIKTGQLELLYQEKEPRLLRTVGMEGSKLILLADKIDNSPGPCASIWSADKFEALELADVKAGLSAYTMPEYQVEIGKKEQAECQEEMKGDM